MENLIWGSRNTKGRVTSMNLMSGGEDIATFVEDSKAKTQYATIADEQIRLELTSNGSAEAKLPNGATYDAHPNKSSFGRSSEIMLDLGKRSLRMVNESKSDWVIEDQDGTKLGQFTGANHGVRHVVVEMEPDAELNPTEAVFVAWVARLVLEEKMLSTTWILTLSLAALTPFIIWVFLI